MPTADPNLRLRREHVPDVVASLAFGPAGQEHQRGVGLEVEVFGFRLDREGVQRVTRQAQALRLDRLAGDEGLVGRRGATGPLAPWPTATGLLTFEPGGQLEFSGGVHGTAAAAMEEHDRVLDALSQSWAEGGELLASVGVDLWTNPDEVAQQLAAPRYQAMDAYFASRGPAGRRMMRNTSAMQVNLDPGLGEEADERWRLANLAAPLVTASFAHSPAPAPDPAVSLRARTWRQLDPTRTGIPRGARFDRPGDRVATWQAFALDADVLLWPRADGATEPGTPGTSFRQWLEEGDDVHGWPTREDLAAHLSTLFPEVRPRGPLEIRSIDALPRRWRAVPVVLLTGLLYDPEARAVGLELLSPRAAVVHEDLARAGEVGLKDPELCAVAVEVWSYALAGAHRLGTGWHRTSDLHAAERFIDQFTMRGRCPGDELRERLDDDPVEALRSVCEPHPEAVPASTRETAR